MGKHGYSGKSVSPIIKLVAHILPIALITLVAAVFTTSAMVNLEPVSDAIVLETLGQGEQSAYVIHETGNGYRRGEKLTWMFDETLGRVSVNGSVKNPWVTLPGETGVIQRVYQDRTGIYGQDVIVTATSGNIWRIDGAGNTVD